MGTEFIRFKYPISKLGKLESENIDVDDDIVEFRYSIKLDEENKTNVYLDSVSTINGHSDDGFPSEVQCLGDDLLSLDTCFRIFNYIKSNNELDYNGRASLVNTDDNIIEEIVLSDTADSIGYNHVAVTKFLARLEMVITAVNYFDSKNISSEYENNFYYLRKFIDEYHSNWKYEVPRFEIEEFHLKEEDRTKLNDLYEQLVLYTAHSEESWRAPYKIYDKMAAIVDEDYYGKRTLLRTFRRADILMEDYLNTGEVISKTPRSFNSDNSGLYCSFILNNNNYKEYISAKMMNLITYSQNIVNSYFAAGLSQNDITAINIMKDFINKENDTKYHKELSFGNGEEPIHCVGILKTNYQNLFAFSGFTDVRDSKLQRQLLNAGDKLSSVIQKIENDISKYNFKAEITNVDEVFFDKLHSKFIKLNDVLPLTKEEIKNRYVCCEKKLFSHIYKKLTNLDELILITTISPCVSRGCRVLIRELRKSCKSITAFFINYKTGNLCKAIF